MNNFIQLFIADNSHLHIIVSFILMIVFCYFLKRNLFETIAIVYCIGVIKELYDYCGGASFSLLDILGNIIGILIGTLILFIL